MTSAIIFLKEIIMNALTNNSTALQSSVLGVQNISVLNQEQKQKKAEIAQASLMAESNNKKSKGADQQDRNVADQNSKVSAERMREMRQKSLEGDTGQEAANIAAKDKSEEARAIIRFETMMEQQKLMEKNQAIKASDEAIHNNDIEEEKFNDAAVMEIVSNQQKAFDARYAYGALADAASTKNIHTLSTSQEHHDSKTTTKSMTGELKVEKFIAPVPITEIKAPIMPADHIYVITQATEKAAEALSDKRKDAEIIEQSQQKTNASTPSLSLVSMNGKTLDASLEPAPEGTKSPHHADAPDLSYGLAS